jgi:hypothetical protein
MKKIYILAAVCFSAVVLTAWQFLEKHVITRGTSYSVSDNRASLVISMRYDYDKAIALEAYIDSCFQPIKVFNGRHEIEKDIVIAPATSFHITASEGAFHLTARKKENSSASLAHIKEVCEGLKSIILAP